MVATKLKFLIRTNLAGKDEKVCVLGNIEELGAWDHTNAVSMQCVTRVGQESTWEVDLVLQVQKSIEYKYIFMEKQCITRWETITGNRTVTPGVVNFALEKPCMQSSTYVATLPPAIGPRGPEAAVNGNTNGYHEWMCCHTEKENQPWWQVDLGINIPICSIVLWNRQDRATERLFPAWVLVSTTPFKENCSLEDAKKHAVAEKRFDKIARASEWSVPLGDEIVGRYVRIQLEATTFLHFAELEIFHRVNFSAKNAAKLYDIDDVDAPEYSPLHDKRDLYMPCPKKNIDLIHQIDDGLFGLDFRNHSGSADVSLAVDDGWLTNESGSELRLILGRQFFADREPIHLKRPRPVTVEMRVLKNHHVHWPSDNGVIVATTRAEDLICESDVEKQDIDDPNIRYTSSTIERHRPVSTGVSVMKQERSRTASTEDRFATRATIFEDLGESGDKIELSPTMLRKISAFENLTNETLETIIMNCSEITYPKMKTIILRGEPRRYLYFVKSGLAQIVGQSTVIGERVIAMINPGRFFGEMAMLGGGIRTATVRAGEDGVSCLRLDRNTFISIIGIKEHNRLREEMYRKSSEVPITSTSVRWQNDAHKVVEVNNPEDFVGASCLSKDDIQVFRVKTSSLEHQKSTYLLDVFAADGSKELIGSVFLMPSQFHRSNGCITAPIVSFGAAQLGQSPIVGQCLLRYTLINPLVHPNNNLSTVWRKHWRSRPTLDVGHRGLGRSFHQVDGYRAAAIQENTLVSFIVAGQLGADYIEFDVQLTKDRIPVVYHDFFVEVGLEDLSDESKGEHYIMGIHDLTVRHLDRCRINPVKQKNYMFQRLVNKHWKKLVKNPKNDRAQIPTRPIDTYISHLINTFPRLRNVLECVPEKMGLNVEIKYPASIQNSYLRDLPVFEMNSYLDAILKVVFDYAGNRRIIFSCFDPDVCIMLRAKQARYPVFFLTCAGTDLDYADARCLSIQSALLFAKMERIQGIVSNSDPLIKEPELIKAIKNEGLLLFTWGDQNSNHEAVQFQKMHGVDAVISDNVGDLTKMDGKAMAQN